MSDIIRAAEAAGLYIESHQTSTAAEDLVLFCAACGKALRDIPKGSMTFTQTHGSCTCSWSCCDVGRPSNRPHACHLQHRPKIRG